MTAERRIRLDPGAPASRPYDVLVGAGLIPGVGGAAARLVTPGTCALVTEGTVAATPHPDAVERSLVASGFRPFRVVLPPGEAAKTFDVAARTWDAFAAAGLDRTGLVVAVGGGAVGDAAGFAAALWMRGVPVVHVPTTLLAMADSAVGGKTAVDHAAGKNLVGTVHQPVLVVADIDTLGTLPQREFVSGFAEIVKCAVLADRPRIAAMSRASQALLGRETAALVEAITFAVETKAAHVRDDPLDTRGVRAMLNLGHTTAHAFEAVAGFGAMLHGEAVAIGLVVAARIGASLGLCDAALGNGIAATLSSLGLPVAVPPGIAAADVVARSRLDKKNASGVRRMVLPTGDLGAALVAVSDEVLAAALG